MHPVSILLTIVDYHQYPDKHNIEDFSEKVRTCDANMNRVFQKVINKKRINTENCNLLSSEFSFTDTEDCTCRSIILKRLR
jgi:hypothetical protein